MIFSNKASPKRTRHAAFLYAVVFNSALSVCVILLLCISFFIQPIHHAYAQASEGNGETDVVEQGDVSSEERISDDSSGEPAPTAGEEVVTEEPVADDLVPPDTSEVTTDESTEIVSMTVSGDESTDEEPLFQEDEVEVSEGNSLLDGSAEVLDSPSSSSPAASSGTSSSATLDPSVESTEGPAATTTDLATSSQDTLPEATPTASSGDAASPDPTSSSGSTGGVEDNSPATSSSEDEGADELIEEDSSLIEQGSSSDAGPSEEEELLVGVSPSATSSDSTVEPITELSAFVNDDNFYQFSRGACVAVGDGTFHCSERTEKSVDATAAVYSDIGPSGNLEIFIRMRDGKVEQLTDNNRDDSAPHYDAESLQVVWQRMVDSRYQIIVYDLRTEEETQLTFARTNNMEPKVSPDGIVWQSWDGDDWEVMYFDGTYTDQITDNSAQDVAPAIQDGYIVWSVLGEEEQLARVYTIETGETMSIVGHEGGKVANPRFVLVYDTQFDNGDIITQGFDPETGLASPISAQPRPEPIDIPNADTTGETIALIQNKPPTKDDKEKLVVTVDGDSSAGIKSSATTTATTSTHTLNLHAADVSASTTENVSEDGTADADVVSEEDFTLSEYDLVIINDGEEVVSTSTPEEVITIPRTVVEQEIASSTQQTGR